MLDFRIQYALHTTSFEEQPLADFEFNEEGTKVLRCPAGHSPKSCSYMKQSNQCAVSFLHEQCANCPYQDQCKPKIFKRVAKIVTSKAAHERAKIQRNMSSEEFKIMQGSVMEWKLFRQISDKITIWKRCLVENSVASSFSVPR